MSVDESRAYYRKRLTDANVDLSRPYLVGNLVDSAETTGALPIHGVECSRVGYAGSERGHACSRGTTRGRKDVSDGNVLNECRIEIDASVHGTKNAGKQLFRTGVLKAALLGLRDGVSRAVTMAGRTAAYLCYRGAEGAYDDNVVGALLEEGGSCGGGHGVEVEGRGRSDEFKQTGDRAWYSHARVRGNLHLPFAGEHFNVNPPARLNHIILAWLGHHTCQLAEACPT